MFDVARLNVWGRKAKKRSLWRPKGRHKRSFFAVLHENMVIRYVPRDLNWAQIDLNWSYHFSRSKYSSTVTYHPNFIRNTHAIHRTSRNKYGFFLHDTPKLPYVVIIQLIEEFSCEETSILHWLLAVNTTKMNGQINLGL